MALAALLPLAVLSLVLGVVALRNQQFGLEETARERVARIAAVVERELEAQIETLTLLARAPVFDAPRRDEAAVAEFLTRARRARPLWLVVSLSDVDGNRLIDVPELIGGERGRVVDLDSHQQVVETHSPMIGSISRGPRDRAAFAVRVPVLRSETPGVQFVLTAVIDPAQMRDLLFAAGLPQGWTGAVIDGEGRIIARTAGPSMLIGQPASESAQRAARNRGGGFYEGTTLEGVPSFSTYQRLQNSDWSVHIGLPMDSYRAPIVRSIWLMVAGVALTLALVAAFAVLLVRERRARQAEAAALEEARHLEALGRMTGGVAHDFNNLLMIVQGAASAIRRNRANPDRATQFIDAILAASERGAAITRHLLAFARRSPHEAVTFDLAERLRLLEPLVQRSTREDVALSIEVAEGTAPVRADPNALEVALINLAVNARDAMPGGGRLSISATNATLAKGADHGTGLRGEFVAIRVADSGVGIPPEHLPHVFEPFFTTKSAPKGTGLGLSQVFGFARQSGGGVSIESEVGRGTAVTLYLPRANDAPVRARPTVEEPAVSGGRRVLLVEDDPDVARVTEDMLASAGFAVVSVVSAEEGLRRLGSERFDVVLSDIVLGAGMSGLDLARAVRERDAAQPVVLMTGYSEALAKGDAAGWTILAKPFRRKELLAALKAVLGEGSEEEAKVIPLAR